jgi:hypothetical protein
MVRKKAFIDLVTRFASIEEENTTLLSLFLHLSPLLLYLFPLSPSITLSPLPLYFSHY